MYHNNQLNRCLLKTISFKLLLYDQNSKTLCSVDRRILVGVFSIYCLPCVLDGKFCLHLNISLKCLLNFSPRLK